MACAIVRSAHWPMLRGRLVRLPGVRACESQPHSDGAQNRRTRFALPRSARRKGRCGMTAGPANGWQSILAAASPDTTRGPQITQAMLAEFEELKGLEARKRQLREELLSLLAEGAEIQPGPLRADVQEYESRTFSFAKLCAIGGEQWAEDVRNRIEPTMSRRLVISSDERAVNGSRPRAANQRSSRPQGRIACDTRDLVCGDDPWA